MKYSVEATSLGRRSIKRLGREAFKVLRVCDTMQEAMVCEDEAWLTGKYRAVQIREVNK